MKDSRRPYRVFPNPETCLFDIWTKADDTPGSRNNYKICCDFQDPNDADEFCRAVNSNQILIDCLKAACGDIELSMTRFDGKSLAEMESHLAIYQNAIAIAEGSQP